MTWSKEIFSGCIQAALVDEKDNYHTECKPLSFINGDQKFQMSGQNPESTTTEVDDGLNIHSKPAAIT